VLPVFGIGVVDLGNKYCQSLLPQSHSPKNKLSIIPRAVITRSRGVFLFEIIPH
jgi:hypothetical protein